MAKRARGEGSIIQRKDGRWMARAVVGYDVTKGKPIRKAFYGQSREEAAEKMNEALSNVRKGTYSEPEKMLYADWLDKWFNDYVKTTRRPNTVASYEHLIRNHMKPVLGHLKLREIRAGHIQRLNEKTKDNGGTLSNRTVRYLHTLVHGSLEQAFSEGLIIANPARAVKQPKRVTKEIKYFNQDEITQFLKLAKESHHYTAYLLELTTGLRVSELLALRWRDIDMKEGIVKVRRGMVRVSGSGVKFLEPKTNLGKRSIGIPVEVVEVLKFHKAKRKKIKDEAGEAWIGEMEFLDGEPKENDLVFHNALGKPWDANSFTKHFQKLLKDTSLEGMTFHGMRHTFATMSLQEGVDVRTIQENLGHHNAGFTLNVYANTTQKMKQEATAKIGKLLNDCRS